MRIDRQVPNTRSEILEQQKLWASDRKIRIDKSDYTETLNANLFQPLHPHTREDFQRGSGDELGRGGRRGKMQALHSSSALAVNFFDYWRERPLAWLSSALSFSSPPKLMRFEAQFSTGLQGTPPNLDIEFVLADGRIVVVESKFTEPYAHAKNSAPFKEKYFPSGDGLWKKCALPLCQDVAHRLQSAELHFQYLNAAQLLKHVLGVAQPIAGKFTLVYLWYDFPSEEAREHEKEVAGFASDIQSEVDFHSLTYHDLFLILQREVAPEHEAYLDYICTRYFQIQDHPVATPI